VAVGWVVEASGGRRWRWRGWDWGCVLYTHGWMEEKGRESEGGYEQKNGEHWNAFMWRGQSKRKETEVMREEGGEDSKSRAHRDTTVMVRCTQAVNINCCSLCKSNILSDYRSPSSIGRTCIRTSCDSKVRRRRRRKRRRRRP
jgi:hypothetical protein